jgi:hypothetical protein
VKINPSCHHNPSSEKNENLAEEQEKNDSKKVKISVFFEGEPLGIV